MIVFLTLIYVAALFVLIKLKVLPNSKGTWLSTIVWVVVLFIFLFIPMQWGAPSGPVSIKTRVVQILPNVNGQVTKVHAEANVPLKQGDLLFEIDAEPFEIAVELAEASKARVEAQAKQDIDNLKATTAQLAQAQAKQVLAQSRFEDDAKLVDSGTVSESRLELRQADLDAANGAVAAARAAVSKAEIELGAVTNDGRIAKVAEAEAKLAQAEWNLEQTKIYAPSEGYVTNLALAAGQRVTSLPFAPAMAFVDTGEKVFLAQIHQIYKRYVEPGQTVEIAMKTAPGQLFTGTVEQMLPVSSQGQAVGSGNLAPTQNIVAEPFLVRIKLDDPTLMDKMAPGSAGVVAIYTDRVGATHVIRKVMIRMTSIMNYLRIGL